MYVSWAYLLGSTSSCMIGKTAMRNAHENPEEKKNNLASFQYHKGTADIWSHRQNKEKQALKI